jgi:hypothetical protein
MFSLLACPEGWQAAGMQPGIPTGEHGFSARFAGSSPGGQWTATAAAYRQRYDLCADEP